MGGRGVSGTRRINDAQERLDTPEEGWGAALGSADVGSEDPTISFDALLSDGEEPTLTDLEPVVDTRESVLHEPDASRSISVLDDGMDGVTGLLPVVHSRDDETAGGSDHEGAAEAAQHVGRCRRRASRSAESRISGSTAQTAGAGDAGGREDQQSAFGRSYEEIRSHVENATRVRARYALVAGAIVLVGILIVFGGFSLFGAHHPVPGSSTASSGVSQRVADGTAITSVPNLAGTIGGGVLPAVDFLGDQAALVETDTVGSRQIANVSIAADGAPAGSDPAAHVYLTYSDETVTEALYSADVGQLGYTTTSFAEAIADTAFIRGVLESAGIDVGDYTFEVPEVSEYQTMEKSSNGEKVLTKEEYTYSGKMHDSEASAWALRLVYDHMATGSYQETATSRMLYLNVR